MMQITKAKSQEKNLIMQYWKQAFPDARGMSPEAYFDLYYNENETFVLRDDQDEIISVAQVKPKVLNLTDKKLRVDYISNVFTRQKFQGQGYMSLLIQEILKESSKENIMSVLRPYEPSIFRRHGFENVISLVEYSIPTNQIPSLGIEGILLTPSAKDLLQVYQNFTSFFDGYFERDEAYFDTLIQYVKASGGNVVALMNESEKVGYCAYVAHSTHVEIIECAYDMSGTLIKLLSFVARGKLRVNLIASTSEKIHKLFPEAKRTSYPFIMAVLHDKTLFERLYSVKVLSSYSAFNVGTKPKFNRDYQ